MTTEDETPHLEAQAGVAAASGGIPGQQDQEQDQEPEDKED